MFHDRTGAHLVPTEPHFRWRGGEITRLEGFTDTVFAFAVTLLVVSLEVPRTYDELVVAMKGFFAFAVCFYHASQVWYFHCIYSRRYGLQTTYVIVLNAILLFVVLFYVYPLKFLFTLVVGGLTQGLTVSQEELNHMFSSAQQVPTLMVIYSLGYVAVCAQFALLYHYAYTRRTELELNEYESLRTIHAVFFQLGFAGVGVLVIVLALLLPVRMAGYAGMFYSVNGVIGFALGSILGKKERMALARMESGSAVKAQ